MNKKKSLWVMIGLLLIGLPLVTFAITKVEDNFKRYISINKQVQVPYLKKDIVEALLRVIKHHVKMYL